MKWYEISIFNENPKEGEPTVVTTRYLHDNIKTSYVRKEWKNGKRYKRAGDLPTVVIEDDEKITEMWLNDKIIGRKLYRKNGPALITTYKKTNKQDKAWFTDARAPLEEVYRDGGLHAVEIDGDKYWIKNCEPKEITKEDGYKYLIFSESASFNFLGKTTIGSIHRDNDLPAVVKKDGTQMWYDFGELHRVGKPAVVYPDGKVEYWEHNKPISILKDKLKGNEDVMNLILKK